MARKDSLTGPGYLPTKCANRARSTACSVTDCCGYHACGSSKPWSHTFGGRDSSLSISSFSVMVFACLSLLSVRAATVAPAHWLANFAALQTSGHLKFYRYSFQILSFVLPNDFSNSRVAWAVAANAHLLPIPLPSWLLSSFISPFYHLLDKAQILIFLAVVSSTLRSACWHHMALLSMSSHVVSTTWYAFPVG